MENLTALLIQYDSWVRFFHISGAVLAIGAVVAADLALLWLKFRPKEAATIAKISPIFSLQIWLGLIVISLSGLALFLTRVGVENYDVFQFKMLLVLVVFLNGVLLNIWITPRFEKLVPEWAENTRAVRRFTAIAGVSAAVSFIGWWGILILMYVFY